MPKAKVSVIVPAFLAEGSLADALESVFAQTLAPHEVIVINDGSPDRTADVARSYSSHIIYREQINAGQGAARNVGLGLATGEFVAFLDADDYWKPTFLNRCTRFLHEHPEAVAVSTGLIVKLFDGSERIQPRCLHQPHGPKTEVVLEDFFDFWAREDHVRTGSNLIRRSVIQHAGFQRADLRVSQDLEYWGYIATFGRWGFIPEPLWVGNSRSMGARQGWLSKYQTRRRLCPSVEAWQERLLPRLSVQQMPAFNVVRGRVAAGYAHSHILAGRGGEALQIMRAHGDDMPRNRVTRLLRLGVAFGPLGWRAACLAVRVRESIKHYVITARNRQPAA